MLKEMLINEIKSNIIGLRYNEKTKDYKIKNAYYEGYESGLQRAIDIINKLFDEIDELNKEGTK